MTSGNCDGKMTILFDLPTSEEFDDGFSEPPPPSLSSTYEGYTKFPPKLRKINCQPDDAVSPLSQSSKATSQYSSMLVKSDRKSPSYNVFDSKDLYIKEQGTLEVKAEKLSKKVQIVVNTEEIDTNNEEENDDYPSSPLDDGRRLGSKLFPIDSIMSKSTKSSSFETPKINRKPSLLTIKKAAYKAFSGFSKKSGLSKMIISANQ